MRLRTLVPALATCCCLWAAEDADPRPPVEARLADGAVLLDHLAASPLGRAWADPACAPLHRRLEQVLAQAEDELGFAPLPALRALHGAELVVLPAGQDPGLPALRASVAFTDEAAEAIIAQALERSDEAEETEIAGTDEAAILGAATLARWQDTLGLFLNLAAAKPAAPAPAGADLRVAVRLDRLQALLTALIERQGGDAEAVAAVTRTFAQMREHGVGAAAYRLDILPEGIRERLEIDSPWCPGALPVDRAVLARLPTTTLMAAGLGFDGAAYWQVAGEQFKAGKEGEALAMIDTALHEAGITATVAELVTSLRGTLLVAITQGVPFPGLAIALPRSPAIDQAVEAGLGKAGVPPPAEGASVLVPLPERVPVALSLVRSPGHWLLTTDAGLAMTWPSGAPGGWQDTAAAKLALAQAPAGAYLVGASDTPAVLRTIGGYLGMAMAFAKDADPEVKAELQAGLALIQRLAVESGTGYLYAAAQDGRSITEGRGVLGAGGGHLALAALVGGAVALQRLEHHADAAEPAQAPPDPATGAALLKGTVFPAEVQFQAGAYVDQDHDGRGEYGLIEELGGVAPVGGRSLALIDRALASDEHPDWVVTVFLPDGEGGVAALGEDGAPRQATPAAADQQERRFVAYAWPRRSDHGTMLAITEAGTLYAAPYTSEEVTFDSLFGGQGWDSAPVWERYVAAPAAPAPAPKAAAGGGEPLM